MPSPKDPVSTILPGPGKASDGTVSASALDFDPSVGPTAALAAHIAAAPAHDDSAISSGPFSGTFWQIGGTTTAEAVLSKAFEGLNARGVLVLDANLSATDADFTGSLAITNAISVGGTNILFCRPGTYDWPASTPSNVTIIGGGSPYSNSSPSEVFLQNTGGNITIGTGVTLRNVILSCSGVVNVSGASGGANLENVSFKITGNSLNVTTSGNVFKQCSTHASSTAATKLVDSGGGNTYEALKIEQANITGNTSTFRALTIGSTLAPPTPASPLLRVSGLDNVFEGVSISHSGAAITSNALAIDAGINNSFRGVVIPSLNTSAEAVKILTGGSNNRIDGLRITSTTCTHVVSLLSGSHNSVTNVTVGSTTVTGGSNVINIQSQNHVVDSVNIFTTTGVGKIVSIAGSDCVVSNITATAVAPTISFLTFESGSFDNRVERWTQTITPYVGSNALFHIQGTGNNLQQVELDTVTTMAQAMILFNGATNGIARVFTLANCGVTAGAGFQLCLFGSSSVGCKAGDISVATTTTMATTSGLINFSGVTNCEFDGLRLNNVATSGAINSPIMQGSTSTNTKCVFRNVQSSNTSYASGTILMDIDQTLWSGLLIERVQLQESYTNGVTLKIRNASTSLSFSDPIRVRDCLLGNTSTSSNHGVWVTNFGCRVIFEGCTFNHSGFSTPGTSAVVRVDSSWNVEFCDCLLVANGASTITASILSAGVQFNNCTFSGPGGGTSGTQLFQGYGFPGDSVFPVSPLVIRDCTFLPGTRNNDPTNITNPMIFIGGAGTTIASNHGPTIIDGLTMRKPPSITNWHRSPLLSIDAARQDPGVQSSFKNILIDLEGASFTGGSSGTVVDPVVTLNGSAVVVEIAGQDFGGAPLQKTTLQGLKLLGLPRDGGGGYRAAFLGSGLNMRDCVFDGFANPSAGTAWGSAVVGLSRCDVSNILMFPTASIPVGTGSLACIVFFAEDFCNIDGLVMENFDVHPAEQLVCVSLLGSTMRNSRIFMQAGSHIPIGLPMIAVGTDTAGNPSQLIGNRVTYEHYATSSSDVRLVCTVSDHGIVKDNYFANLAVASAAGYSSSPGSSNGGGCQIFADAEGVIIADNTLLYTWATGTDTVPAIVSNGTRGLIKGNYINNQADNSFNFGGSTGIYVTGGLYTTVSENTIQAYNSSTFHIRIDTTLNVGSAGTSMVIGNTIDNRSGNNGEVYTGPNDKPQANISGSPSTYNILA